MLKGEIHIFSKINALNMDRVLQLGREPLEVEFLHQGQADTTRTEVYNKAEFRYKAEFPQQGLIPLQVEVPHQGKATITWTEFCN